MPWRKFGAAAGAAVLAAIWPGTAFAAKPAPWQIDLQPSATSLMDGVIDLHNLLLWIITVICLFVLALLLWIMVRYNARVNREPSKTSHHTLLEFVWTVIPVIILVVIAIPSIQLLRDQDTIPEADMTLKAIGKQWYWTYQYPDHDGLTFDSLMLTDEAAAAAGEPRLLGVDNRVVVPVGRTVRVIVTASDVIHSWAVPAFGVKMDAVPGRLNETWFNARTEGVYYGQCSELCGARHAFMPIAVEVVSEERFAQWLQQAKEKFAADGTPTRVAAAGQ